MKRRSREINIFSISTLDLFASAMGAFILITLALFPFFPNTGDSPERVSEVREEMREALEQAEAEAQAASGQLQTALGRVADLEQQLAECQGSIPDPAETSQIAQQLATCRAALEVTFAVVVISWGTPDDDVDLHVVDPNGNEYYFAERSFPGSGAAFEEDTLRGPGNEIWQSLAAQPGTYEIYVNMYAKVSPETAYVRGFLLHQNGREELPQTPLTGAGQKPLVATFTVDTEGNVTVR
jgi:hypothetical protein